MKRFRIGWFSGLALVMLCAVAQADIPKTMALQGRLTDSAGAPLEGNFSVTFKVFDVVSGGPALWQETQTVAASAGLFSTLLGTVTPLTLAFDKPYWVEIQVGAETLSPRQPLASSPYALRADQVSGLTMQDGKLGIGTTNPQAKLHVAGNIVVQDLAINKEASSIVFRDKTEPDWWGFLMNTADNHMELNRGLNGLGVVFILQNGNVGIGTTNPQTKLEVNGATRLMPAGKPSSPAAGMVYFDASTKHFYGFDGTVWKQLDN